MASVESAIGMFQEEARRILWLPSITLGYLYTLSASDVDFWLAVGSLAGAYFLIDFMKLDVVRRIWAESTNRMDAADEFRQFVTDNYPDVFTIRHATIMILYLISIPWALWKLYSHFDPSNIVTVGLAAIYWGF